MVCHLCKCKKDPKCDANLDNNPSAEFSEGIACLAPVYCPSPPLIHQPLLFSTAVAQDLKPKAPFTYIIYTSVIESLYSGTPLRPKYVVSRYMEP